MSWSIRSLRARGMLEQEKSLYISTFILYLLFIKDLIKVVKGEGERLPILILSNLVMTLSIL